MAEMESAKRHVVEDFPAASLPKELIGGIDRGAHVRVTVEQQVEPLPSLVSLIGSGEGCHGSAEETVAFIRRLRDEWDSRQAL